MDSFGFLGCTPTCGCNDAPASIQPVSNGLGATPTYQSPAQEMRNRVLIPVAIVVGTAILGAAAAYYVIRN